MPQQNTTEHSAGASAVGNPTIPGELHARIRTLIAHCVDVLNASDSDHPEFLDCCADTVELFWNEEAEIKAVARALGIQTEDPAFLNQYRCERCGEEWENEDAVKCNDRCPRCRAETEPFASEELKDTAGINQAAASPEGGAS